MQFRFLGAHRPQSAVAPTDQICGPRSRRGSRYTRFFRASQPALAAAAFALSLSTLGVFAPSLRAGQAAAATKNWKDRAEYDLYVSITQAADPAKRLELLNQWQDKYPQTDYMKERLQFFVATTAAAGQPAKTLDYAAQLLKIDPKDFTSLYYTAQFGPGVYGSGATADQQATVVSGAEGLLAGVDTAFDPKNKPKNMTDDQWTTAKNSTAAVGHSALGWAAGVKKDLPGAEKEYLASLQLNPANGQVILSLAGVFQSEKKYQETVFYYARAVAYDGPGALPAEGRTKLKAYLTDKIYTILHGSADGLDAVLATAKTNATPPAGFHVVTVEEMAKGDAAKQQAYLDANPGIKLWFSIQQALIDGGQTYFDANVKDADLPGGANDVKMFKGIVISMDPAEKPTKIVLGVYDSAKPDAATTAKPDATLVFEDPITVPVKAGDVIEFSGVADSFTKDPFMLTFKDPNAPTLKPAEKPKPARKRPAPKKS